MHPPSLSLARALFSFSRFLALSFHVSLFTFSRSHAFSLSHRHTQTQTHTGAHTPRHVFALLRVPRPYTRARSLSTCYTPTTCTNTHVLCGITRSAGLIRWRFCRSHGDTATEAKGGGLQTVPERSSLSIVLGTPLPPEGVARVCMSVSPFPTVNLFFLRGFNFIILARRLKNVWTDSWRVHFYLVHGFVFVFEMYS